MTERPSDQVTGPVAPAMARVSDVLLSFVVGFLLALLQYSYFFLLEVYLSSRALSFFVALFFWLIGFLVGLNLRSRGLFPHLLTIGVLAYYPALAATRLFPFNQAVLPLLGLCIGASGLVPGYFFVFARDRFRRVGHLFFHENNGFLLGIFVSLLCAVFAGKWLLTYAPVFGLAPILCILAHQKWIRPTDAWVRTSWSPPAEQSAARVPVNSVFPFFATGLHFGVLQAALFFAVQVHVTATYMGYFIVVLAWMLGVILNLKLSWPGSLHQSLLTSAGASLVMLLLTSVFAPYRVLIPVYFVLVVLAALPAGAFFRQFARSVSVRSLFLHENNGFILGLLLGMLGFVKWGVNFLYLAPLMSCGVALLSFTSPVACVALFLPGAALLTLHMDCPSAGLGLLLTSGLGAVACFLRPGPAFTPGDPAQPPSVREHLPTPTESRLLLTLAGCGLILLQQFITREFSTILAASELAILVVGIAHFTGISVGYCVSQRLPQAVLKGASVVMFMLHLGMLLFVRVCAGYLIHAGYGLSTLVGLLFLAAFCTSSLFSIFLPRLIDQRGMSLVSGYTWDLSGAVVGTGLLFLLTAWAPWLLWPSYFLLMLAMILVLFKRSPWRPSLALLGLGIILALSVYQGKLRHLATEDYYRTRDYDHPKLVFQGDSFYHAVEVIDTFHDSLQQDLRARTSFINGVPYFRHRHGLADRPVTEASLSEFTYFLAELPAKIVYQKNQQKLRVLIMGGGSMTTIKRVHPYASKTTLVEIDPLVVDCARKCWSQLNRHDEITNYEIVIDDVKHYLQTTREKFDLIINDISAPYYLGTTLLHGREFYARVESHLKSSGLFSESTQGRPRANRPDCMGMKILRGVADVFPRWRVVDCQRPARDNRGFVYASESFGLSTSDLTAQMKQDGKYRGTSTYWEGTSHFRLHKTRPYSLTNMETLLTGNVGRIKGRMNLNGDTDAGSLRHLVERVFNPTDPLHSHLCRYLRQEGTSPAFLGLSLFVVLSALALRWAVKPRTKSFPAGP